MGELLVESLPPRNLFDSMMPSLLLFSHQMCICFSWGSCVGPTGASNGLSHQWTGLIMMVVHSHLMLSQCLNENLGGILHGTQC
jgi:hypothetical protein